MRSKNTGMIKKTIIENEWLRLFILTALVIYSYSTFISGVNIGAADAHWYQLILHDALIQLDHGIFPVYVGQSQFNFFGSSEMRSPYYLLLGQLLHILTFKQLNALYIQHLTVLISAFGAAFITYFLLTQLVPNKRWSCILLAFLYISCPGVIGLIYKCDMYHIFMLVPFIPLAIYGLTRTHLKNDYLGYIITAMALSLALMSHAPVAIWTIGICFFFYGLRIIFLRKGFLALIVVPCLIAILNFWQFVSLQSLGLRNYLSELPNPGYADWIMKILHDEIPGVFLPLGWESSTSITPFLQYGYSYWLIIFIGILAALRPSSNFLIRALIGCALLLLVLLYPIPLLTRSLWLLTPNGLHTLTIWPMQRFYIILAALASFLAILLIQKISQNKSTLIKRLLSFTLLLIFSWNLYQTFYFVTYGMNVAKTTNNFWLSPENMYFITNGLLPVHNDISIGHFDPTLKNSLLNGQQQPIPEFDNEQYVIDQCAKHLTTPSQQIIEKTHQKFPVRLDPSASQLILKLQTPSEHHLLLCLKTDLRDSGINIEVIKPNMNTALNTSVGAGLINGFNSRIISIPIFHSEMEELTVNASASPNNGGKLKNENVTIKSYGLISYHPEKLPIRIDSFTPYKAQVETKTDNTYLRIFKEYFPGYKAFVDDKEVSVLASKDHQMVMIPIKNRGFHHIKLVYSGLPEMKISFYVSALAWFVIFMLFVVRWYRNYSTRKSEKFALIYNS